MKEYFSTTITSTSFTFIRQQEVQKKCDEFFGSMTYRAGQTLSSSDLKSPLPECAQNEKYF